MRAAVIGIVWIGCAGVALAAVDERVEVRAGPRCVRDALGVELCAREERGVALVTKLGDVRCAPGACMRAESGQATAWDGEWLCASVAGGGVGQLPDGPRCDGECRPPRATDCEKP